MGKAIQGMDFICDIDGTLMNIEHRRHFVEGDKKDWKSFEDNIKHDTLNKQLNNLINLIEHIRWDRFEEETYDDVTEFDVGHFKNSVYYFSGRSEKLREITVAQILTGIFQNEYSLDKILKLIKNDNPKHDWKGFNLWRHFYKKTSDQLFLRADKDYREDSIVKSEMLDKLIETEGVNVNSLIIFDDRQSVVDMWRERGVTCFQVNKGDF
tara:strand:- start:983 stop:1612 length:630 start_codon:yes stop_codon:yes gene_type:complete